MNSEKSVLFLQSLGEFWKKGSIGENDQVQSLLKIFSIQLKWMILATKQQFINLDENWKETQSDRSYSPSKWK
jgi:hypothetical protein